MTNELKHIVCIEGKRNVDKLSDKLISDKLISDKLISDKLISDKLLNNPKKHQRSRTMKWTIDDTFFTHDKQLEVLRRLIADDTTLDERKFFIKEINNKLNGYARQDKENGIHAHDLSGIISLNATVELLLVSKLRCAYCRECCELIYKDVMAPRQWTLDRVDNDRGHSGDNVTLACLACNLQRRTMDADRFKFGKQLRIVKGF
jgi:RNase P subunit RPR2